MGEVACHYTRKGRSFMLRDITSVKHLARLAVLGLALATVACSSSSKTANQSAPPLPSDSAYNPAGPNCYPDINHCASYPSGGVTKDNPAQPSPTQK
jgi:hypothetical protein